MREDSDRWEWTNFSNDKLYPSFGDNLPYGWEVHFGLNPLNRSDALNDPDYDVAGITIGMVLSPWTQLDKNWDKVR